MERQQYTSVQRHRSLTPATQTLQNDLSPRTCACGEPFGIDGLCTECRDRRFSAGIGLDLPQYDPSRTRQGPHLAQQATAPGSPLIGHNFSQLQVHAAAPETIQTKLKVNQSGDSSEQEADQVAGQLSLASASPANDRLENDKSGMYRKGERIAVNLAFVNSTPPKIHGVSHSPGQLLDTETRMDRRPRFGHDFSQIRIHKAATQTDLLASISPEVGTPSAGEPLQSQVQSALESSLQVNMDTVRVHTDARSAAAAESLSARAFTCGPHIFLGSGEHPSDLALMAHEGAHVVQQQGVPMLQMSTGMASTDTLEREADQASSAVQQGEQVTVTRRTHGTHIQLEEKSEGGILKSAKDALLGKASQWARRIPGFDLLALILGKDPVTDKPVERSATNVVRALMGLIPGGSIIFENLQKAGTIQRAFDWFNQEIAKLNLTWEAIKGLFRQFWDALSKWDIFSPTKIFEKMGAVFGPPLARLRDFAVKAGQKILEFIFEGVLSLAGGAGKQILGIIRKAGAFFAQIIKDPLGFLGNLIKAVKGGFQRFSSNIVAHLKMALFAWLFGALQGAGLTLPEKWDMRGILSIVLQVLGLTYTRLRAILAKLIGEPRVAFLEKTFDFLQMLVTQGIAAAWQKIMEFAGGLTDIVIEGIRNWVAQSIVGAAITKLISMFNPVGAIIQGIITIYNVIAFFIERAGQIAALVEAIFSSIANIASGNIGAAIDYVEKTMARTLPVIIAFLARLVGLGGISGKIKGIIQRAQVKVEGGVTKVAHFVAEKTKGLVAKGKAVVGIGGKKPDERTEDEEQKKADLQKALAEADDLLKNNKLSDDQVKKVLLNIKSKYRMSTLEFVVDSKDKITETVHVQGEINPKGSTPAERRYRNLVAADVDQIKASINTIRANVDYLKDPNRMQAILFEARGGIIKTKGGYTYKHWPEYLERLRSLQGKKGHIQELNELLGKSTGEVSPVLRQEAATVIKDALPVIRRARNLQAIRDLIIEIPTKDFQGLEVEAAKEGSSIITMLKKRGLLLPEELK